MKRLTSLLAVSMLIISSTTSYSGSNKTVETPAPTLDGTKWIFEANSLGDIWAEPVGQERLTLEFKEGRVNGFAGCNSFFGEYTQTGNRLSFGPLGSTRMLCEDNIQHQEDVIFEALSKVTRVDVVEVLMHMDTGGGTSLVYRSFTGGGQIIDYGGLHTFETCREAGGQVSIGRNECRIDGKILIKDE